MFRVQIIFVLVVATYGYRIGNGEKKVDWSPHKLYFPGPISRPDPDKRIHFTPRPVVTKPPDHNVTPIPVVTKLPDHNVTPIPVVTKPPKDNATPTPVVTKPPEDNDLVPEHLCTLTAVPPDPDSECCGVEATSSNRIVGGNVTQLEQYPWLVLIQYYNKVQNRYKNLCGGFLISGRYVVSAAHCFVGEVLEYGTPINVILGDYNTTNEGPDCAKTTGGGIACTDGAITVPIESVLVSPEHYHNRTVSYNDIALIRLKTTVKYSKYIRPICLPTSDVTVASPPDLRFYAAGWGAVKQRLVFELGQKFFAGEYDFVKRHVDLPYIVNEKCRNTFTFVDKGHICAGGEKGKDSCKGDSGGPLMYENDGIFEVIGIVSTGPLKKPCGTEGYPAVYTKVFDYVDWIKKSIKR